MKLLIFLILIVSLHTASKILAEKGVVKHDRPTQPIRQQGNTDSLYYFNSHINGTIKYKKNINASKPYDREAGTNESIRTAAEFLQ